MSARHSLALFALALGVPFFTGFDCDSGTWVLAHDTRWTNANGNVSVAITATPFSFVVSGADGSVLLESTTAHSATDPASPIVAYAPLSLTHDTDDSPPAILQGINHFRGIDDPWQLATRVRTYETTGGSLIVHLWTSDPNHPTMTVAFSSQGIGVHIVATVDAPGNPSEATYPNRVSLGFALHDSDHFFGLGERFVNIDEKGHLLYTWAEEGGLGEGENVPPGPSNPTPSGEGETYLPMPWVLSPLGFGMLINTTYRLNFHLGEEVPDAWRVEATSPSLDMTVFADPDPLNLIETLTAISGRPPEIADWVLAPRRRADLGSDEMEKLRAAHIPTSVIDTAMHYFPIGPPVPTPAVRAYTKDIHDRGFQAVAYFNPFVAQTWEPVYDEAAAKGYFVKHADGTVYAILGEGVLCGMVDFTNPDAVTWYQGWLQQALDDGWDGWMYDFGEYVPQDAVMFNGMSGFEAHNLYPVLYQKAAHDLLERVRQGNYLVFARSGYTGTSGLVPMIWDGDNSTDFDLAKGLPAALVSALNAGMSGIPLWGSDISGYFWLNNPPPDKELYLRWTELGAFSADMHDENEGDGNGPPSMRWQIWDDQESQDVYRTYASTKTRMLPYVRIAVREARARGTPVMRHLYLMYPKDPNVLLLPDEYMYGDSLLVAPVVHRGLTSRSVYLPEAQYFDFWSGARVKGAGTITAAAPLDDIPVYAKVGAIVPMLAPDVETVVPSADDSVVSMQDRANYLEVQVFAGGQSSAVLDDGTTFTQAAPEAAFTPGAPTHTGGAIAAASGSADLMTCSACYWDDAASHVWSVAVVGSEDTVNAGALTLSVRGSPSVKRFVFTVRH